MRRKIAVLLCALMCMMAFTGCSKAELAYLQMSANMLKDMKVSEAKGTTTITMDFDALEKFANEASVAVGGTADTTIPFDGKETVQLDYVMTMDTENLKFVFDVDATHKGKTYDFGKVYCGMGEMYVTGQTLAGLYDVMKATMQQYQDSYMFSAEYEKEFKAILDKNAYICLYNTEDLGLTEAELQALNMPNTEELYQAAIDLYRNAFANFTTNMITEIPNGFHVEATGTEIGQMLVSMLDYMAKNPETVMNALEQYLVINAETANASAEELAQLKDVFVQAKTETAAISQAMTEAKDGLAMILEQPNVAELLKGFSYQADTTENNGVYTSTENYVMGDICTINTKVTTQKSTVAVTFPTNAVKSDAVATELNTLEDKYNPVAGVNVMWVLTDESREAYVSDARKYDDALFGSGVGVGFAYAYVVEDGRVYLPLRDICGELGVDVAWNKETRTASAKNGDTNVTLETKLVDGTSYVGVREFEKLGYTVTYTNTDGIHEASIVK